MAENFKTFAIALDIKVASYAKIPVVEGDTGNRFVITLTDDGTAVDLSTSRVTAVFSGAMGTAMQDSWTSTDGLLVISGASHNIVTFDLLNGSYANGLNTCELQVYSGATYTRLVTSASFTFNARKPILNDTTIASTTEYPILVSLIDQVEALTDREQADWDETDNTKGTFINNKPVIGTDIQAPTNTLTAETVLADGDYLAGYKADGSVHRKWSWLSIKTSIRSFLFGSVTGVAKLDGAGNVSAAAANTDFAAATHASRHASGAADAVTPAAIGAAASTHKSNHAYGGSDVLAASDIGQYGVAELGTNGVVKASHAKAAIMWITDTSITLDAAKAEKTIFIGAASPVTITLPMDVNIEVGAAFSIVRWTAAPISFVGGAGAVFCSANGIATISAAYAGALAVKLNDTTWWLVCS